jgi:hypothetical protein
MVSFINNSLPVDRLLNATAKVPSCFESVWTIFSFSDRIAILCSAQDDKIKSIRNNMAAKFIHRGKRNWHFLIM